MINIEVVYAKDADQQHLIKLMVMANATVEQAIQQSNILQICPEIDLTKNKIGIYSKAATLNQMLKEGDRIEIYRPLIIDPKEARRAKAKKQRKA